ncbi:hypothetical protein [Pyxidicoccus sp. MSG2]|uniref:hypothetical protein n=1 Tax=Pyxidicoccus sp. MSG2 TaxID=2996790 RepID=UPI00226ED68F|nr:hypothetical protein [Pyxidicoccus sp. MSG2]MCY1021948.1 hypothetical protein [Pyxidicoccus sp. MSG2]
MSKHRRRELRALLDSLKSEVERKQVPLGSHVGNAHDDVLRLLNLGRLDLVEPTLHAPEVAPLLRRRDLSKKFDSRIGKQHLVQLKTKGRTPLRLRRMYREPDDGARALPPLEVQVKLVSKSRKGLSQFRTSLHDPLKSVTLDGRERTRGWRVKSRFLLRGEELQYRITIEVPQDILLPQLQSMAWEENMDLTFSTPRYLLCSHDEYASQGDVGYRAGTNFAIGVRFGPRLWAGVVPQFPLVLVGQFLPRDDGHPDVQLASYPFTLAMADSHVVNASLRIYSRPRPANGMDYFADLRGLLKVGNLLLPVWTDLPEDEGVLCWKSMLREPMELPLAALDPLMGGGAWRTRVQHLQTLLGAVGGRTWLLEAGLGVDLLDGARTDAHAIFSVPDFNFLDGALRFRDVRLEWEWSHQSGEGQFQIRARLEFCGLTFNAHLLPPDLTVFASLAGQDISLDQAMEANAEGHPPEGHPTRPPMVPMLNVAEAARERLVLLDNNPGIPLEAYDELHLYYSWRTNQLRLRSTAVLEDDTLVEANWTLR